MSQQLISRSPDLQRLVSEGPHIPLDPGGRENIYENNIQISDLNSLNADMAVQLWKGFRGFYANFAEPIWHYQIETRQMIRSAA